MEYFISTPRLAHILDNTSAWFINNDGRVFVIYWRPDSLNFIGSHLGSSASHLHPGFTGHPADEAAADTLTSESISSTTSSRSIELGNCFTLTLSNGYSATLLCSTNREQGSALLLVIDVYRHSNQSGFYRLVILASTATTNLYSNSIVRDRHQLPHIISTVSCHLLTSNGTSLSSSLISSSASRHRNSSTATSVYWRHCLPASVRLLQQGELTIRQVLAARDSSALCRLLGPGFTSWASVSTTSSAPKLCQHQGQCNPTCLVIFTWQEAHTSSTSAPGNRRSLSAHIRKASTAGRARPPLSSSDAGYWSLVLLSSTWSGFRKLGVGVNHHFILHLLPSGSHELGNRHRFISSVLLLFKKTSVSTTRHRCCSC